MTQEAGSKGRASGALTHRFVAPKKMYKHVCLRYMSMSPMGGFNIVSMKHGKEEKRHGRRS
jgi:hypothetical protein